MPFSALNVPRNGFIISIILFVVAVVTSCSAETPEQIFPIHNTSDVPMTGTVELWQESATDLQRAIRYVRANSKAYGINPENIALVKFSAGGILNGEVLLNWRDLSNGTAIDTSYIPDDLDEIPLSACAVGMIYSFYGRLSVSMNDVETLRNENLPPAFYSWGTRDGFAGQFTQNANAVEEAGCPVERKILHNYPHGYGSGGSSSIWGNDFDEFLTPIMAKTSSGIQTISMGQETERNR